MENDDFMIPTEENTWNVESSLRHEIPKAKAAVKKKINQEI